MNNRSGKIKVAVLGTRGFPGIQGGVESHCEHLYPLLAEIGCDITVFARKPYVCMESDTYRGIKIKALNCPKNKFLEAFYHTLKAVVIAKKLKPDILHFHAIGPSLLIPLARLLGLKAVMTHHGPDYERKKWGKIAKSVLKLGERAGCLWSDEIIAISRPIAKEIEKKYRRKANIIPNGVNIPEPVLTSDILKQFGIEKGKYVLAVGRFVPEKGFHDLIKAFEEFNQDGWKLVIVGDADHEDGYSRDLKKMAAQNRQILMPGFLKGMPLQALFQNAGIFVLPSYYEGLPIVLLEAMSWGLLCIASDIDANKQAGLSEDKFFPAGDIGQLALKLQEYAVAPLSDNQKKSQIEFVKKNFNWQDIAKRTLTIYEKVSQKITS